MHEPRVDIISARGHFTFLPQVILTLVPSNKCAPVARKARLRANSHSASDVHRFVVRYLLTIKLNTIKDKKSEARLMRDTGGGLGESLS